MPIGQGIERCQGVLDQAEEQPTIAAAAQQALAVLHALAGRTTEARSLVRAARATLVELNQPVAAAASAIDEGIVHLLSGDAAAAEKVLEAGHGELEQLGEKGFYSTVTWLLAEAVAAQGRTTEARALARTAAAAASPGDVASQVGWRAIEARALSRAGAHRDAEQTALEAVRLASATEFPLVQAHALAALADTQAAAGRPADCAATRAEAVALLERKGANPGAIAAWVRP